MEKIILKNPYEVFGALKNDETIKSWLKFISKKYVPPQSRISIFYPCTTIKPFGKSQSYRQLFKTLAKIPNYSNLIHIYTISEPFGIIPFELGAEVPDYDCPGLFEWWCKQNGELFDKEYQDKSIEILAKYTSEFLNKLHNSSKIAIVRTYSSSLERRYDHTHFRILKRASELANQKITFIPNRKIVNTIIQNRGRFAWDRYGPAHPIVQDHFLSTIQKIIKQDE